MRGSEPQRSYHWAGDRWIRDWLSQVRTHDCLCSSSHLTRRTPCRSMLSPLYLAEISPPEVRGSLMALEQFAIVLGVVLGFWTGFFTRERMYSSVCQHCIIMKMSLCIILLWTVSGSSSWRLPLAIQILPAAVLAFGSLLLPSSPRLLILQGQPDEARIALARLRLRTASEESDPLLRVSHCSLG